MSETERRFKGVSADALMFEDFTDFCNYMRKELKKNAADVLFAKGVAVDSVPDEGEDRGEMIANLMLCYRHMEDASMRLGKCIQAQAGGVSIYDHNAVGDPKPIDDKK